MYGNSMLALLSYSILLSNEFIISVIFRIENFLTTIVLFEISNILRKISATIEYNSENYKAGIMIRAKQITIVTIHIGVTVKVNYRWNTKGDIKSRI